MQKKRIFLWIGILGAVGVCLFGWPSFRNAFIQWTLREYCRTTLGCSLSYEKFSYDSSTGAFLEGITLKSLGRKEPFLHAKSASIQFQLLALKRTLRSFMEIKEPQWDFDAWERNWEKRYKGRRLVFRPEWIIEAKGGTIASQGKQVAGLDMDLKLQQAATGSLKGYFGDRVLALRWREDQDKVEVVCQGERLPSDQIWPFFARIKPFFGTIFLGEGECSGQMTLLYEKGGWILQEGCVEGKIQDITVVPSKQIIDHISFLVAVKNNQWLSPSFLEGYLGPIQGRFEGEGKKMRFSLQTNWQSLFAEWKGLHILAKMIRPLPLSLLGEVEWGEEEVMIQGEGISGEMAIPFHTSFSWNKGRIIEGSAQMRGAKLASFFYPSSSKINGELSVDALWNEENIHIQLYPLEWALSHPRFEWKLLAVGDWEWNLNRKTGFSEGIGEIKGSSLRDLETHLGTDDLSAQFILRPEGDLLVHIETEVEGILAQGEAEIKEGEVIIEDPWIEGDLDDIKKILLTYLPLRKWESLCLRGRLISRSSKTAWSPINGLITEGIGQLQGGSWTHPPFQLGEFHADVNWDSSLAKVTLFKGEGTWEEEGASPLHLVVDELSYNWMEPHVQADFWLSDRRKDVMRIAGAVTQRGEDCVLRLEPEKTHFGPLIVKELGLRGGYSNQENKWEGVVEDFQIHFGSKASSFRAERGVWAITPSPLAGELQLFMKNKKEWKIRYSEDKGWELPKWEL